MRCLCARSVDPDAPSHGSMQSIERLKGLLVAWGATEAEIAAESPIVASEAALRDDQSYGSALSIARSARANSHHSW